MYQNQLKPLLDRLLACILVILLSPVLLVGFLASALDTRGNPIFIHTRPGLHEKPIRLIKFRTMRDEFDSSGRQLTNMERITRVGRFLRNTSIDELPQLFNVLIGDLSLVGPRPLEMRYLPHYSADQRKRHLVRPGITGLAQISGRNSLDWSEKFELDIQYVNSISLWQDLEILVKTGKRVFSSHDVNADSHDTMVPFVTKSEAHEKKGEY